jgi:hypothetical protein
VKSPYRKLLPFVLACLAVAVTSASAAPRTTIVDVSASRSATSSHDASISEPGIPVGRTVLLDRRTRRHDCTLATEPDRRCSPGAYYSGVTKAVLCSPDFRSGLLGHVSGSLKRTVEAEYRLGASRPALKIDHVVPLELGGSNSVANLFPQRASAHQVKNALEHVLHARVCQGLIGLRAAQRQIAADWQLLYTRLNGVGH